MSKSPLVRPPAWRPQSRADLPTYHSMLVVRIGLVGCVDHGHMRRTDVRLSGTELALMSLPELLGAHLDTVGVFINPAQHLSEREPGFGVLSAHRSGSQDPYRVTNSELMRFRLWGRPGSQGVLLVQLLANLPRHSLLPRKEVLGI